MCLSLQHQALLQSTEDTSFYVGDTKLSVLHGGCIRNSSHTLTCFFTVWSIKSAISHLWCVGIHFKSFELLLSPVLLLSFIVVSDSQMKNTSYSSFSFQFSQKKKKYIYELEVCASPKDKCLKTLCQLIQFSDIWACPKIVYVYRISFRSLSRGTAVLPNWSDSTFLGHCATAFQIVSGLYRARKQSSSWLICK